MAQISVIRPGEPIEPYDYSIMLVGTSATGKTTFLNALINIFLGNSPGNLQVAEACHCYPNIIPELDDSLHEIDNIGKSQTTYAHFYKFKSSFTDNKTILVVDTPGFASNKDINIDDSDEKAQIIINAARRVKFFNAIIVFQMSSINRLYPLIEYLIYRISEVIPEDFKSRSIILALTFFSGTSFFDESWLSFPIQYKIKININAFGYSTNDYQANPKNIKRVNWDKSVRKIEKFLAKLFTMKKIPAIHFISSFSHQNTLMDKIMELKSCIYNLEKCIDYIQNSKPKEKFLVNKWVKTDYYNIVCSEHRTLCQEDHLLSYNESDGTSFFNSCSCMNAQKVCEICGCSSEQHTYLHKKPRIP